MKTRIISTKIYKDEWFTSLSIEERFVFVYFLTNERVNILHCYEISWREVCFDLGIDQARIVEMLKKFEEAKKIYHFENYIYIANAFRYESYVGSKNENAKKKALQEMPVAVREWYRGIYRGIDTPSIGTIDQRSEIINHRSEIVGIDRGINGVSDDSKTAPNYHEEGLKLIQRSKHAKYAGNASIPILMIGLSLCATVLLALFYMLAPPAKHVSETVAVYEIGQVRAADSTRRAVARSIPPKVKSSPVLPEHSEIIALIKKHFGEDWRMAYAICRAECGCRPEAVGDGSLTFLVNGKEYGKSYGVFQIRHLVGRPEPEQLADAEFNVQYAAGMYKRSGWGPWSVYHSGSYLKFLETM